MGNEPPQPRRRWSQSAIVAALAIMVAGCPSSPPIEHPPAVSPGRPRDATQAPRPVSFSATQRAHVYIQPLGPVPDEQLTAVQDALTATYGFEVHTLAPRPLPRSAYYPARRRYRAERLLDFLEASAPPPRQGISKLLGVTAHDISTSTPTHSDWGIFGLGRLPGRTAVLSTHRLRPKLKKTSASIQADWQRRIRVVAIHEIGHTLGLAHCDEHATHCPMRDAEGSIRVADDSTQTLGPKCRARLGPRLGAHLQH